MGETLSIPTRGVQPEMASTGLCSASRGRPLYLRAGELRAWIFPLDLPEAITDEMSALLAEHEIARANRFRFDLHRCRFIAGRATLRLLLGRLLGCDPASLVFKNGPYGKPALVSPASRLAFNMSHSGDVGCIAIGMVESLGVDVEQVVAPPEMEELVAQFFCPAEAELFASLEGSQKPQAFFNLWTRKEAYLKATGLGISHLLNQVEVSFVPGQNAELRVLPGGQDPRAWRLVDVSPGHGLTACICTSNDAMPAAQYNLECLSDLFPA